MHTAAMASEWPPHTKNYLERGGTIEAVIKEVLAIVTAQDEMIGDGCYFDVPEFRAPYLALPTCRNDNEWGFIEGMLLGS